MKKKKKKNQKKPGKSSKCRSGELCRHRVWPPDRSHLNVKRNKQPEGRGWGSEKPPRPSSAAGGANDPELNAEDVELLALVAKGLVGEGIAGGAVATTKGVVEPEAEAAAAPATDRQEPRLAEHAVVVGAAVGEVLEPDALPVHGRGRG